METRKITSFRILMFPWLAHGHIFPFLELAKRILKRKTFYIYLSTTAINFPSVKTFIEKNLLQDSMELVELNLDFPQLPPHYHTTKNLPSNLNLTLVKAFQTSKSSISDIINRLNPDLVLYDIFQPWTSKISKSKGIPAVFFSIFGGAMNSYIHYHYTCGKDSIFPFQELSLKDYEKKSIDNLIGFLGANVFDGDKDSIFLNFKLSSKFVLLKTVKGFEGKFLDYIYSERKKELVCVGPLVSNPSSSIDEGSEILRWLSKKDEYSTVYISFGSEYFLSNQEIEEIAKGLELCGVNFIWVVRFPVGDERISIHSVLPEGFLDRVKDRGIMVEGWAPQAQILAHKNIGGFMSHCGWSSINESIYFGVPVIGMPMKLNMFVDARMLVDAGACVEVSRDEDKVYRGEGIAKAIDEVIVGETGEGLRRRAQELRERMKLEEEPALDEATEKLWQLCSKNKKLH